jgi:periplasmic divalent cation tolerance protein
MGDADVDPGAAVVQVQVTCADHAEADLIADTLVSESLAACVHISPVTAVYRWKGRVERETEIDLAITTTAAALDEVVTRIGELHSYDLPAIWWFGLDGGAETVDWALRSVQSNGIAQNP